MQEVDLRTGLVMFEWHSVDHVPLRDSYTSPLPADAAVPYDFFHINSIDPMHDGSYLVSARNTWAAYDVDQVTGRVRWALGGTPPELQDGARARCTAWQHDAARAAQRRHHVLRQRGRAARPPAVTTDRRWPSTTRRRTATLVSSFEHPTPLVAGSQGNFERAAGRRLGDRLGPGPVLLAVQRERRAPVRRPSAAPATRTTAPTGRRGAGRRPRRRPWPCGRAPAAGASSPTRAGTAPRTCGRGACSPARATSALAPVRDGAAQRLRDRDRAPRRRAALVQAQALGAAGQVLATSPAAHG